MSVTQFAVLNLTTTSERLPHLYNVLMKAIDLTATFSGSQARIFSSLTNERRLFLLHAWDSLEKHNEFKALRSEEKDKNFAELRELLDIETTFDVDVEFGSLPLDGERVGIRRIRVDKREDLNVGGLEGVGGWKIDESGLGGEERVQFSSEGWEKEVPGMFEEDEAKDCEADLRRKAKPE